MKSVGFAEAEKAVRARLSEKRFRHSLAVSESAEILAQKYGADPEKAAFAGLIHDVCKDDSPENQLQMMREFGIILSESERACPKLWHAVVGAAYVGRYFTDEEEIIRAVRYHTTARCNMSLLEKVIYVADCISADRNYPGAEEMRRLAEESLDAVIYAMSRYILSELTETGLPLHPDTVGAYNQLCLKKLEDFREKE